MFSRHLPNSPSLDEVREAFEECCEAWADHYTPDEIVLVYKGSFVDVTDTVWTLPEEAPAIYVYEVYPESEEMEAFIIDISGSESRDDFLDENGEITYAMSVIPQSPYEFEILPISMTPIWSIYEFSEEDIDFFITNMAERVKTNKTILDEEETRLILIDPILRKKGWTDANCSREETFHSQFDGSRFHPDYTFYISPMLNQKKLVALLEAKHNGYPPDHGLEQAKGYADHLQRNVRFVFSTNGLEFVEYDRLHKRTSEPKPMSEFPTPVELHNRCIREIRERCDPPTVAPISRRIDRSDATQAKRVIDFLCRSLNQAQKKTVLQTFARAIEHAHAQGAGKWGITLGGEGRFIRLNVGSIESCVLSPIEVIFAVDRDVVKRFNREEQAVWNRYVAMRDVYYRKVLRGAKISPAYVLRESLEFILPLLWRALAPAIEKSAAWVRKRTEYYTYHSPGIVAYLEQELGIQLPRPIY